VNISHRLAIENGFSKIDKAKTPCSFAEAEIHKSIQNKTLITRIYELFDNIPYNHRFK
jgi:hypothetical protein